MSVAKDFKEIVLRAAAKTRNISPRLLETLWVCYQLLLKNPNEPQDALKKAQKALEVEVASIMSRQYAAGTMEEKMHNLDLKAHELMLAEIVDMRIMIHVAAKLELGRGLSSAEETVVNSSKNKLREVRAELSKAVLEVKTSKKPVRSGRALRRIKRFFSRIVIKWKLDRIKNRSAEEAGSRLEDLKRKQLKLDLKDAVDKLDDEILAMRKDYRNQQNRAYKEHKASIDNIAGDLGGVSIIRTQLRPASTPVYKALGEAQKMVKGLKGKDLVDLAHIQLKIARAQFDKEVLLHPDDVLGKARVLKEALKGKYPHGGELLSRAEMAVDAVAREKNPSRKARFLDALDAAIVEVAKGSKKVIEAGAKAKAAGVHSEVDSLPSTPVVVSRPGSTHGFRYP